MAETVDANKVLTGGPDQLATGAILSALMTAEVPVDPFAADLGAAYHASGYVSEDGLSMTVERNTSAIKDWSGAEVRKMLESFSGQLKWANIETNEQSLKTFFGDENVSVTAATADHGERLSVKVTATELPRKRWVFRMKDGNNKIVIVVPIGQITETEDVTFVKNDAVKWGVTLSCYPDAAGNSIYIYFDNGKTLAA